MYATNLFNQLLMSADELQREFAIGQQYSTFLLLATLRYCKQNYTGFAEGEESQTFPYEEERLRCMLKRAFLRGPTACARYIEFLLKKHRDTLTTGLSRDELLQKAKAIAESRKHPVFSADIVLAVALEHLDPLFEKLLSPAWGENPANATTLVAETDVGVYDYVISEIDKLIERLHQKAEAARAERDWRPARLFAPPEEVEAKLRAAISMIEQEGFLQITIPYFFADTGDPLRLTVYETDEGYVIHDNGDAVGQLKVHLSGGDWREIAERICAGTICQIEGTILTVCMTAPYQLSWFLQYISLVAHADLYPHYNSHGNRYEINQIYLALPKKDEADFTEIRSALTRYLSVSYDENAGIRVGLGVVFLGSNTGSSYILSTDEQGVVTITDHSNSYKEGAVLENYLNYHDDTSVDRAQVHRLAKRFGGSCNEETVFCTFVNDTEDAVVRAIHRFVQMGVVLSQVGYSIPLDSEKSDGLKGY